MESGSSGNKLVNNSFTYSKSDIIEFSNFLKLVDTDTEKSLDMYCYNSCDNNSNDIIKRTRGVVFNNDNVVFAGFPYVNEYVLGDENNLESQINFENFSFFNSYEGTLIRMFNFDDKWYVTTHRKLDAFRSKWAGKTSFGDCFKNGINQYENLEYDQFLESLNKDHGYLFLVLNNNENRIVCMPPKGNTVIHVGTIKDGELDLEDDVGVEKPQKLAFSSYSELTDYVQNISIEEHQGVIMFDGFNQYKLLNQNYQELYKIRGNEPSIKFRYLQIRGDTEKVNDIYYLYPKFADKFDEYEDTLKRLARQINNNYVRRFIKKKYVIVPKEQYEVMKTCHEWHLQDRERNRISLNKVSDVINKQTPTSLNRMIRKFIEENKEISEDTKLVRPRAKSDAYPCV
jgi:hypothetical protein